jgi:TRAP-type C4-dicarboxylate transport system permease small subunit
MMALTVVDILFRLFATPLLGIYELVCYFSLAMVAIGLADAELEDSIVSVTFVEEMTPPRFSKLLKVLINLIGACFFLYFSYRIFLDTLVRFETYAQTDLLRIPLGIPMGIMGIGFFLLGLALLLKVFYGITMYKTLFERNEFLAASVEAEEKEAT